MTERELQLRIDEFLERHGMSASTFGIWAMNDSRFVFDLRAGRSMMTKTLRRVLVFMRDYDVKRGNRKVLVSPPTIESVRERAEIERAVVTVLADCEQS